MLKRNVPDREAQLVCVQDNGRLFTGQGEPMIVDFYNDSGRELHLELALCLFSSV